MPEITPKVSVSIITYNHKNFIRKTIESVLQQEVTFPYEIIIGDDGSTDGTREILLEFKEKYPDLIHLVLHPQHGKGIPGRLNNITNLYACRGQYIAMLDGDDHWISTDKLQKQFDFLEQNAAYAMAFHDALVISENNSFEPHYQSDSYDAFVPGATYTYQDIAEGLFIQTSSLFFRKHLLGEFPDWFWHVYSADYAIQLLVMQGGGKAKYMHELKSARLINQNSFSAVYSRTLADNLLRIDELKIFRSHLPSFPARKRLGKFYFRHAILLRKAKKYPAALLYLAKAGLNDWQIGVILYKSIHRRLSTILSGPRVQASSVSKK